MGRTTYQDSVRLNLFGGYDVYVDSSRVGQTWSEVLDVEDGDDADLIRPDQDIVLFDRDNATTNGRIHKLLDLEPLSVPLPPPTGDPAQIPPIDQFYRGEVDVGSTMVKSAVVFGPSRVPRGICELACDGPQTTNPDGSSSCPASGRHAIQSATGRSPAGSVESRYFQVQDGRATDAPYPFPD